jgi:hypothetical protein
MQNAMNWVTLLFDSTPLSPFLLQGVGTISLIHCWGRYHGVEFSFNLWSVGMFYVVNGPLFLNYVDGGRLSLRDRSTLHTVLVVDRR